MPRPFSNVRHCVVLVGGIAVCLVISACTDDSTTPPGLTTTVLTSIVVDSADVGASATVAPQRSYDACVTLRKDMARRALGVVGDGPVSNLASGERCTWRDDSNPTRFVTLTQDVRHDPERFFADHPEIVEVSTDDQTSSGLRIGIERVDSGDVITMLLADRTYTLSIPAGLADVPGFVADMLGIGQ